MRTVSTTRRALVVERMGKGLNNLQMSAQELKSVPNLHKSSLFKVRFTRVLLVIILVLRCPNVSLTSLSLIISDVYNHSLFYGPLNMFNKYMIIWGSGSQAVGRDSLGIIRSFQKRIIFVSDILHTRYVHYKSQK